MSKHNLTSTIEQLIELVNENNFEGIQELYHTQAVLIPIMKQTIIRGSNNIKNYYQELLEDANILAEATDINNKLESGNEIETGLCRITWLNDDKKQVLKTRVSLLLQDGKILVHHSDDLPI